MVQRQERVKCSLWGEEELLWQVKEVKYHRVLFMSAEKVEREIDSAEWCAVSSGAEATLV